ncbi:mechanosensitive ion channel family protein [Streptomyces otsuchiensis]|uniref:mechanosensitive ion channel family protein n=1 Tax=Streptomyces otsuchiensis TaxID=2681388 RepID=UPI00102F3087|nr:mechanosensitive ion channel domain-containing protein [Streptomyces otsuchiensis]
MQDVLRPVLVIGGTIAVTLIVGWIIDRALHAATTRKPQNRLPELLRRCQLPLQVLMGSGAVQLTYDLSELNTPQDRVILSVLATLTTASAAWLAIRVAGALAENSLATYASRTEDVARVRQFRTQLAMLRRIVTTVLALVAAAVAMLIVFPGMRALGASLLASAGVIGIIAGVAAQSMLGNLFAGLQIAFGDSVKIGDTVVVEGEWGTVEEISLAFLTVRIWDDRRLTMPISYFNNQPYENWSKGGHEITGTVFFHLDHAAPVKEMRAHLHEFLLGRKDWDGRAWGLLITDTTPTTIEVRASMSAQNADDVWTVRCAVREEMINWLRENHPYAFPRVATSPAAVPPSSGTPEG